MPLYHIWTIGCQMNKAESDRLSGLFEQQGYTATDTPAEADVIVLNSCVVRQSAENRAIGKLRSLKPLKVANPNLTVALTGCLVDSNTDKLKKSFPHVDHFFKPGDPPPPALRRASPPDRVGAKAKAPIRNSEVCAYLPIIQGCDNFCSYCIVPYRRGRERSLPVAELVKEASELVRSGAREITLVGQNVDSYGHDLSSFAKATADESATFVKATADESATFVKATADESATFVKAMADEPGNPSASLNGVQDESLTSTLLSAGRTRPELADLLAELNGIEGLARLRFLTNHPKDMTVRLIEAVATLDKVCEHLYLPVQHGDDDILKLMRRDYTVEHYRQLIAEARRRIPGLAVSTDIIVGFPSETEEQFQHTYNLLDELKFDVVHIAAYSPRQGTVAARELKDDVPPEEKDRRLHLIEELQTRIATEINARLLGKTVEVLVEGRKKGKWQGRTRSGKLVFFTDNASLRGQLVNIKIDKTSPWSLQGDLVK